MKRTPTIVVSVAILAVVLIAVGLLWVPEAESPEESMQSTATRGGLALFQAGALEIGIATIPDTPKVGENGLVIELRDPHGDPVTDAEVRAHAEMPAMGAMPAMRAPAGLTQAAPGRFEGELDLPMRGEWPLTVQITDRRGEQHRLSFELATDRAGLTIAAGGAPIGTIGPIGANAAANADSEFNAITIDSRRRQMIGLKTGLATHRDLVKVIRAVGRVTYNERLLSHVTLKFDGYIGDLQADYVGTTVEKDQVLFTVYSPELLAAQHEYLETLKRRGSQTGANPLLRAARQRLALWDMTPGEIKALERRGVPQDYVAIHAPRSGTLIERNITEGGAARKGQTLLTIADLSSVWIEADIYEADFDLIPPGTPATITLPYLPERSFATNVEFVYPYLHRESRTGRVRLTLGNASGDLKPDMYAEVAFGVDLGHRMSVPDEAVIVAGQSRIVFVDLGEGQLRPTRVKTGRRAQGFVEVLDGLDAGDLVVTSGNFLISAETRLRTGVEQW